MKWSESGVKGLRVCPQPEEWEEAVGNRESWRRRPHRISALSPSGRCPRAAAPPVTTVVSGRALGAELAGVMVLSVSRAPRLEARPW